MDEIEKKFHDKAIIRGDEYLFPAQDALRVIESCFEKSKKIYGIDAFLITEHTMQIVDYIDYTTIGYKDFDELKYFSKYHVKKNSDAGHWLEAEQFIKDRVNNRWVFEIVYQ